MSIFSVGTGGLNAAQVGILTASHNIANASTPGYNRQEIVQGTNFANLTGAGYIGAGTNVQTVKRIYDQFLARQILSAEAGASEMDAYLTQVQQLDNLFADPDAGLSPALAEFFKGVQEVAANPASIPARQAMLSSAQSLVARFQGLDQRMKEVRDGLNAQIKSNVESINTFARQVADLNQRIVLAEAGARNHSPNDLYDQREQLITEMNKVVRVTTVTQSDGSYNVFVGKGQPLVIGSTAYALSAVADPADPERYTIAMNGVGGTELTLPESQITGGTLGGLLRFRSGTLDAAQNSLGRIAITLTNDFNAQHSLGIDLTGVLGKNFFSSGSPALRANSENTGSGVPTVSIDTTKITELSDSDYRLSTPDGATFQLLRLSDGKVTAITAVPQTVDGISINVTGWSPNATDSFLIQPTREGARNISVALTDTRAIAAASPVRTSALLTNTGKGTIDAGRATDTTNAVFGGLPGELNPPVMIQFDSASTYSIYDYTNANAPTLIAGGFTYNAGKDMLYPGPDPNSPNFALPDYGYQVRVSGSPATGDRFVVQSNQNGVADNRNAMLLGSLQTKSTMLAAGTSGATASYQSAYSQIVSFVGSKSREVKTVGAAQQGLADATRATMQTMSGVNLDEEAANLLRYQQAYQASAKILQVASKIFDEVIALGR